MVFHNSSTAGDGTIFNVESPYPIPGPAFHRQLERRNQHDRQQQYLDDVLDGDVTFIDSSTAAEATIINNGGLFSGGQGANTHFLGSGNGSATAGNATITAHGGTVSGALGGSVSFGTGAQAGDATLIADGGVSGAEGGFIDFFGVATGDRARVELFGTGSLLLTPLTAGVTIGSLEGDGVVVLGSKSLTIGSNNLSTTFSGVIQDDGSLTKIGTSTLTLSGANTYTGGTTIEGGKLVVNNMTGSGTGVDAVQVNAGVLGGRGTIAGGVTVGTGSGPGAALGPGRRGGKPDTLTIQSTLTFNSDATYNCGLNTKSAKADQVVANGVTVNNAQFSLLSRGGLTLPAGTVLTVINNTAATPIAGTFANLPDGSTFTTHGNTFQANYEGGDGNDLTLTVVP